MPARIIIAVIVCSLMLSCDKNSSDDDDSPWPVWILLVQAKNGFTGQPVESCARVIWTIRGSSDTQTENCDPTPDRVKVWKPIREQLTVDYHVECDGYFPSTDMAAFFDPQTAYTRPGAPGDEDIVSVTVSLYPE